ncbi:MAG: hypothetical protein ACLFWG_07830 [Longimicrobiales bacterium]
MDTTTYYPNAEMARDHLYRKGYEFTEAHFDEEGFWRGDAFDRPDGARAAVEPTAEAPKVLVTLIPGV